MKTRVLLSIGASALLLVGCSNNSDEYEVKSYASMANPAAVFCVERGGELETVTENAMRVTYCHLPNGEKVEQWEYFRNHHQNSDQG
ncbi:putative hemolysin [Vibrio sonorensis]|uniref:putative hemolysin n=1 Tax=Vibrio sonorensis TaxID=1004316 RepID=UPI0008D992E3|nr:DUF333 domain-containing protein [Vibrio sonorensis]